MGCYCTGFTWSNMNVQINAHLAQILIQFPELPVRLDAHFWGSSNCVDITEISMQSICFQLKIWTEHYICNKPLLFIFLLSDIFTCSPTAITNLCIVDILHRIAVSTFHGTFQTSSACILTIKILSLCHISFSTNIIKAILTSVFKSIFCACMIFIQNCLLALIFPQSSYFQMELVFYRDLLKNSVSSAWAVFEEI